jgi:hypothetical protein
MMIHSLFWLHVTHMSGAGQTPGARQAARTISGQGAGDRREFGRNVRSERGYGADDDDGDQAGDETIFDGRDAGLIVDKAMEQMTHDLTPEFPVT